MIDSLAISMQDDPRLDCFEEAIYIPGQDALHDRHGRVIMSSSYYCNGRPELLHAKIFAAAYPTISNRYEPDCDLFYIGPLRQHYGHFLLSTFSRLWFILRRRSGGRLKLLVQGGVDQILTHQPYMVDFLEMARLRPSDIVSFGEPTRISRVFVPEQSFEEGHFSARAFRELCVSCAEGGGPADDVLYVRKTGVARGLSRIVNERALVAELERRIPLRIFDPIGSSVPEQIRAFEGAKLVIGGMGSHFHTMAFVSPKPAIILCNAASAPANQVLIDRVAGHRALYLYHPAMVDEGDDGAFAANYRLPDVGRVAAQIADIAALLQGDAQPAFASARGGPNLSARGACDMSSLAPFSPSESRAADAANAVSGFLTGSCQIHTAFEANPWWQIDFGEVRIIDEVQVFNRLDAAQERLRAFSLSVSRDGRNWVDVHRTDDAPIAHLYPFRWTADGPVPARFVRITLLASDYLHLDQVVVFGPPRET